MKYLFLLSMLLFSFQAFAQKKGKVDPKDATIDSLTKVTKMVSTQLDSITKLNTTLSTQLDSVQDDRDKYYGVYSTVKAKVMKHDYDTAKLAHVIDSLKMDRDTKLAGLSGNTAALSDSIAVMKAENTKLKTTIAELEAHEANKEKLVAELKQLKELLDAKIITQAEYDALKGKLMEKW